MQIVDNKCPTCNANLEYNISKQNWKCKHCRNEYELQDIKKLRHRIKSDVNELICPTCNAKLFTNESDLSAKCVFCRNNVIVNKTKDKYPTPDKIIPFKIDKNAAKRIIRKEFKKKKLLPNDINDYLKEIKGIYIPFWLYTNKYDVIMRKKMRIVGKAKVTFKNVPFDANQHLNNELTKSIEPYDYKEIVDYDSAYLSGMLAQRYDVDVIKENDEIKKRCAYTIEEKFGRVRTKENVFPDFINETLQEEQIEYALLPIWLTTIEYKGKIYHIAVNGQSGKVSGEYPVDSIKNVKLIVIVFIISLLVITSIAIYLRMRGII
ncbi:MAG: hypothetical protein IJ399_03960 [Bacilli bacterium]|mgnify:CR=1 FL=1|nr:hypothetical protein [Bacilli bacterium]